MLRHRVIATLRPAPPPPTAGDNTQDRKEGGGASGPGRHSAARAPYHMECKGIAVSTQNLLSLSLPDAELMAIDNALFELESRLSGLVSMDADKRKSLARMGGKSEAFCRQALNVLEQNPQIVPPSLGVAAARADLDAIDRLRPRLQRLQRLTERAQDSETLLGSDVMACALQGYAVLKVAGKNQGLEGLRKELGTRFAKSPRVPRETPAPGSPHPVAIAD